MAELLLKVDDSPRHDDGDILCAFNRRAVRCCHAQHICHVRKAKRNGSGLILPSEVSRDFFEATHQYRFDRLSATEVQRTTLATGDIDFFSDKPNEMGEYMDVRLFIARRKRKADHYLFGEDGAEFWYRGRVDFSHAKLDTVWNAIETKTPKREADHGRWPFGTESVPQMITLSIPEERRRKYMAQGHSPPFRVKYFSAARTYEVGFEGQKVLAILGGQELRSHYAAEIDEDIDDAEVNEMVSQEVDESDPKKPVIIRERTHKVDWKDSLGLKGRQVDEIRNITKYVDLRGQVDRFKRAEKVARKPRRLR